MNTVKEGNECRLALFYDHANTDYYDCIPVIQLKCCLEVADKDYRSTGFAQLIYMLKSNETEINTNNIHAHMGYTFSKKIYISLLFMCTS